MADPTGRSYRWIVLLITSVGAMMAPLDSTIVSVSLPEISHSLNMDYASVIWVPTAYLVSLTTLLLTIGRLSDLRGRRPIFITGFAIFTLSSFLCSISQTGGELILFRIIQGAGAAFMAATSPAIVTDVFPPHERGKALGINAMAIYLGLALGPALGGFLTYAFGWQSIFLVNIPIGTFVILLSLWKLRESGVPRKKERFDFLGVTTFSIGLISLLVALTIGEEEGWTSLPIMTMLITALVLLSTFIFIEVKKGSAAMFDISLVTKNRLFAAANISALLNYTAFHGIAFLISFYMQRVLNYSLIETGLILLVMPITMAFLSPFSGWASDRIGSRYLSSGGMVVIGTGMLLLSSLDTAASSGQLVFYLLLIGVGMGLFSSPNTSAVMGCVEKRQLGIASGTLSTMRTTGQSLSLALMGAVISVVAGSEVVSLLFSGGNPSQVVLVAESFVHGMSLAFVVSATIAFLGALTSFARGPTRPLVCEDTE